MWKNLLYKTRNLIKSKYHAYLIIVCAVTVVLNLLGCSKRFCELYKQYVYGYIASILGFIMSGVPVVLGEILMYLGALLIIALVIILLLLVFLRRRTGYIAFVKKYVMAFVAIVSTVLLIYTITWIIPFRAPHLDVKPEINKNYSVEELQILRNYAATQLNSVAESIERDNNGRIVLSNDLRLDISDSMNHISDDYPLLKGYYPRAKASYCSCFLEWMRIGGYTYPYTMEVSYNKYNNYLFTPVLWAHEQSHHKGYYQENEATYLSILACINSESKYLQYAGYLEFYYYVASDYNRSMLNVYDDDLAYEIIDEQPKLIKLIEEDRADSREKSKELYDTDISPEFERIFREPAKEAGDSGWKAQGEIIGEATYSGCVKYLLEYYDGILY